MRRSIALLLLILLMGLTWGRSPKVPRERGIAVQFVELRVGKGADPAYHLGQFHLDGAWQMMSRSWFFGGYSALVPMPDGTLLAFSDNGNYLRFTPPGTAPAVLEADYAVPGYPARKKDRDIESAAYDPGTGKIWLGLEGTNSIVSLAPDLEIIHRTHPRAIAHWGDNTGAEAMARLADGRFLLLREGYDSWFDSRRHDAIVFEGDPTKAAKSWHFVADGPAGFRPTDMAQLPDGRLLVLMRHIAWPMPPRFAGRLAIADPADIRPGKVWKIHEVARIASSLPVDNFEGLAVVPSGGGKLTVWLISDDNGSPLQRTILWKLSVDPRRLP